jgi:UDP:flavonoid glycosyltransferase YjiC (YdhE family)
MSFELPHPEVDLPPGEEPLVLITNSTAQDPACDLVRKALLALADEPLRVIATTNGHRPDEPIEVPSNARLVEWLSYSQVMPQASLVICHGGHGTVVRALAEGVPVLACPEAGDMAENGARLAWTGTGLMLPKRWRHRGVIRATTRRILSDRTFHRRARSIAEGTGARAGPQRGTKLLEELLE